MPSWPPSVALITGTGSGLGRQLSLLLAVEGVAIAGIDLNAGPLQTLEEELRGKGATAAFEAADVTDPNSLRSAVQTLESKLGPIDLLIASAGVGIETSALSFDAATFARVIQVNLLGVANAIAAVLPGMLKRKRGHLAAISSLASYRGLPLMAGYCASKSGVNALMEAVRVEVAAHGIKATTVCPGWVRTPMTANLSIPASQLLDVDAAARRILAAVRKGKRFVAFPRATTWQVRLLQWLPSSLSDWMIERMVRRQFKR